MKNLENELKLKLNLFFTLIILLSFVVSSIFYYYINKQNAKDAFNKVGINISFTILDIVEKEIETILVQSDQNNDIVRSKKNEIFRDVIRRYNKNQDIESISFWSDNYDLLFSSQPIDTEKIRLNIMYQEFKKNPVIEIDNKKFFGYKTKIALFNNYQEFGYLFVMLKSDSYNKDIKSIYYMSYLFIIFTIFVMIFGNLILNKLLFKHLEILKHGFQRILVQDYSKKLQISNKKSKFEELYRLYNSLIRSLNKQAIDNNLTSTKFSEIQKMYLSILHNTSIGILFFHENGTLFETNERAMNILDIEDKENWTSLNIYSIDFFQDSELISDFEMVKSNSLPARGEIDILISQKKVKNLRYSISSLKIEYNKKFILLSIEDASEENRFFNEQQIQQKLVRELLKKNSYKGVAEAISKSCSLLFKNDAFALDRYDRRNNYLIGVLSKDTPTTKNEIQDYPPVDNRPISDTTYRVLSGEKIVINRKETNRRYFASSFGALSRMSKSFMIVPISHQEKSLGLISIHSYTDDFFTNDDLEIFASMANLCAEPILRIQKQSKQRIISGLLEKLNRPYKNDALGDLVANAVHKLFFYNKFYLFFYDINEDSIKLKFNKEFKRNSFKIHENNINIDKKLFDNFKKSLPYFDNNDAALLSGFTNNKKSKSEMAVGITWNNELAGILLLESNVGNYFNDADLQEFIEFSNHLGGVFAKHIEEQKVLSNSQELKDLVKQRTTLLVEEISTRVSLEDRLSSIIDTSLDAIIAIDYEGIIKVFNISAETLFMYSKKEMLGQPIQTIIPQKGNIKSLNNLIDLIVMNKKKNFDTGVFVVGAQKSDGTLFDVEISASVSYEENNPVLIIVLRDISEKKRIEDHSKDLETKLVNNSRLAKIGEIATILSKEIQEPLIELESALAELDATKIDDENLKNQMTNIKKNRDKVKIVRNMFNHLNSLEEKGEDEFELLNFNEIIKDVETLFTEQIVMYEINFIVEIDNINVQVKGVVEQIKQAILNLVQNAIDAIEDIVNAEIGVKIFLSRNGKNIIIKIKDNGNGIEEDNLHKIFDPFFTTKERKDGGLGLTVAFGIIQAHKGAIYCNSRLGVGSTFSIELPVL